MEFRFVDNQIRLPNVFNFKVTRQWKINQFAIEFELEKSKKDKEYEVDEVERKESVEYQAKKIPNVIKYSFDA